MEKWAQRASLRHQSHELFQFRHYVLPSVEVVQNLEKQLHPLERHPSLLQLCDLQLMREVALHSPSEPITK